MTEAYETLISKSNKKKSIIELENYTGRLWRDSQIQMQHAKTSRANHV